MTGGLRVDGVHAGYGEALVLHGVSLAVRPGELVALLGPNGAGKTTVLRTVTGRLPVRAGAIHLDGVRLDGRPAYHIAALGVATVPEGRRLFDELTVAENLALGAYLPAARRDEAASRARLEELLPVLRERRADPAGRLSGGEQQMVALARALIARPRLLVLDDPFLGLARPVIAAVSAALRRSTAEHRLAVLAAGQHVRRLLALADRAYLLAEGRVAAEGPASAMRDDPAVRRTLLPLPP